MPLALAHRNKDKYGILRRGPHNDVKVCSNGSTAPVTGVIDIGSNSVKLVIYGTENSIPTVIADNSRICGLGKFMSAGDPNPRLNEEAIELIDKKVLPKWQGIISNLEVKPSNYIFLATAAVRDAASNQRDHNQSEAVQKLFNAFVSAFHVPYEGVNIVSEKLEARLAGHAMMCGGHSGFGIMIGGNSCEFVEVRKGIIVNHATLRFGTNSLQNNPDAVKIIKAGFDSLPWFSDRSSTAEDRTSELCALGGTPRALGRESAQTIDRIDSIDAKMPFGGYVFAMDDEFLTHLRDMTATNRANLYQASFGASQEDILRRRRKINSEWEVPIILRDKNSTEVWISQKKFEQREQKQDEKIGDRADGMPAVALILLEAEERLHPRTIDFSPHNMREAALRYTGLGYT